MLPKPPTLPKQKDPEVEIIKNRLYWSTGSKPPTSTKEAYFFSVDDELVHDPFNDDFGPLNLA
jgi:cell division cycle 14